MPNSRPIRKDLPGLTACSLCAGETLGERDTEAGGQLQRLERLAECGIARLTTVECLDLCERGDVVVARPTRASRGAGARPVWFERLAGDEATAELADWLRSRAPGHRVGTLDDVAGEPTWQLRSARPTGASLASKRSPRRA